MGKRVLVTGGAGFIGTHIVRELLEKRYEVTILDNLDPQVHDSSDHAVLQENAALRLVKGDVRDKELLKNAVCESDAIIHLAARVGVGQSMYEVERYVDCNSRGTAGLLDLLVNGEHDVKKLVVASSMSVYGEGNYKCPKCRIDIHPDLRQEKDLKNGQWKHLCPQCKSPLEPQPTNENKPLKPTSIYGMSKRHQEEMSLLIGKTYKIPTVALRFFNVFGPGQALANPYTGCIAIFSSQAMNNKPVILFEDGNQLRDFIYVKDIARANVWALENHACDYQALNVGTGKPTSILHVARTISKLLGKEAPPRVTRQYRVGDIRDCYSDTQRMESAGFRALCNLEDGLRQTMEWVANQTPIDRSHDAIEHLKHYDLVKFGDNNPDTAVI
jgi:dTDP-L-rhamnose 4-epimerase